MIPHNSLLTAKDRQSSWLKEKIDQVGTLLTVESVLTRVELCESRCVFSSYDLSRLRQAQEEFENSLNAESESRLEIAQQILETEIQQWTSAIVRRDEQLRPYHLRRYCERGKLDLRAFAALSRFYRNQPYEEETVRKYDFSVTRLFALNTDRNRRQLRVEREKLPRHLHQMFELWEQRKSLPAESPDDIRRAAMMFDSFIDEINRVKKLEELTAKDFFNAVRSYKDELGEKFYTPEITAAAIACNVAEGNKFLELLETDAPVIHDGVSRGGTENHDLSGWSWSTETVVKEKRENAASSTAIETRSTFSQLHWTPDELMLLAEASALTVPEEAFQLQENREIILRYLQSLPLDCELDLTDFLDGSNVDYLTEKKETIKLILDAEVLLRNWKETPAAPDWNGVGQLLSEIQPLLYCLRQESRKEKNAGRRAIADNLFCLANYLHEAQLKLLSLSVESQEPRTSLAAIQVNR